MSNLTTPHVYVSRVFFTADRELVRSIPALSHTRVRIQRNPAQNCKGQHPDRNLHTPSIAERSIEIHDEFSPSLGEGRLA